jgi:ABC-type phosphate/phosphonate transport system substrate-binding protein
MFLKNRPKESILLKAAIFLAAILSCVLFYSKTSQGERKNYSMYFTFEGISSAGGHGSAEIRELMTLAVNKVMEKTGYNIHLMIMPTWKDVLKKLKSGNVDFVYYFSDIYPLTQKAGIKIKPIAAPYFGIDERTCVYVNAKSGIKDIRGLKGKKMALGTSYLKRMTDYPSNDKPEYMAQQHFVFQFVELQYILSNNGMGGIKDSGINITIDYPNDDSKLIALDRGLIDAVFTDNINFEMYRGSGQQLNNVKTIACSDKYVSGFGAATEKAPDSAVQKMRDTLLSIRLGKAGDKDFQNLLERSNMVSEKAGFIPVTDSDLKYFIDVRNEYEKKGWAGDIQEIVKSLIKNSNSK